MENTCQEPQKLRLLIQYVTQGHLLHFLTWFGGSLVIFAATPGPLTGFPSHSFTLRDLSEPRAPKCAVWVALRFEPPASP